MFGSPGEHSWRFLPTFVRTKVGARVSQNRSGPSEPVTRPFLSCGPTSIARAKNVQQEQIFLFPFSFCISATPKIPAAEHTNFLLLNFPHSSSADFAETPTNPLYCPRISLIPHWRNINEHKILPLDKIPLTVYNTNIKLCSKTKLTSTAWRYTSISWRFRGTPYNP